MKSCKQRYDIKYTSLQEKILSKTSKQTQTFALVTKRFRKLLRLCTYYVQVMFFTS